jgi:hypothetical protein
MAPLEFEQAILYRCAYGLASDLAEAAEARIAGRWANNTAAGGELEAIAAEVLRRLGDAPGQGESREVVMDAVEDALSKRRPRW